MQQPKMDLARFAQFAQLAASLFDWTLTDYPFCSNWRRASCASAPPVRRCNDTTLPPPHHPAEPRRSGIVSPTGTIHPRLILPVVPKLCLANPIRGGESGIGRINQRGEAEIRATHSQAELGNDRRGNDGSQPTADAERICFHTATSSAKTHSATILPSAMRACEIPIT